MIARWYKVVVMTTNATTAPALTETKQALLAYLDALALADPLQARLWQQAQITLTQLLVLRELRQGPQSAGRLGEHAGLSPTSVTRLVDRLERRGLVSRRRDSEDRRQVDVGLTPAGERLLGELKVLRGSPLHRAVEAMNTEDRRCLTACLRQLVEATRSLAAADEEEA